MDLVRVLRQEHLRMRSTISESSAGPTKKASSLQSLARESIFSVCLLSLRTIDPVIDGIYRPYYYNSHPITLSLFLRRRLRSKNGKFQNQTAASLGPSCNYISGHPI